VKETKMAKGDVIVTAYADRCTGPGWFNTPVIAIIRGESGKLREEYIQPDQFDQRMWDMHAISYETHAAMRQMAERILKPKGKK
jgi:hypothetical protein